MRTLRAHVVPLAALLALATTAVPTSDRHQPGEGAPTLLRCAATPAAPAQQQIGPGGGSIELSSGHSLDVPRRALAAARGFEMAELRDGSVGVRISSGASPAAFQRSASLTLSYQRCPADTQAESLIIVRIEHDGTLTPLPSNHNLADRSVTALLSGNSDYALAWP
jgi:hypothetical protein